MKAHDDAGHLARRRARLAKAVNELARVRPLRIREGMTKDRECPCCGEPCNRIYATTLGPLGECCASDLLEPEGQRGYEREDQ